METEATGLIEYLWRNQNTFAQQPLNPVDSLVLSTLAYLEFERSDVVKPADEQPVLLHDIIALTPWDALASSGWYGAESRTKDFLAAVQASRRLRDVQALCFENVVDPGRDSQFSAISFTIQSSEAQLYLAFRGTDDTFVGWREDFRLGISDTIPSQRDALMYLNRIAERFEQPLLLGGHSKGGNLAEYAALLAPDQVYCRLQAVYNHDGPAFLAPPSPRMESAAYAALRRKTIPESSLVGLLLERGDNYRVVQSSARGGVMQHVPYSWLCADDDFVYQSALNMHAVVLDESLDAWLLDKSVAQRELLTSAFFDTLEKTGCSTFDQLAADMPQHAVTIARELAQMDPETKRILTAMFASFVSCFREETASFLASEFARVLPAPALPEVVRSRVKRG